jgi:hypothetical protein
VKRLRILLCTLILAGATGCFGNRINNVMSSWTGSHFSSLIMAWGPPSEVYDDGAGGRILIYTSQRQWATPGSATTTTNASAQSQGNYIWGSARSYTTYVPPQTRGYTAYRMFQANSQGIIYNWSWRGL